MENWLKLQIDIESLLNFEPFSKSQIEKENIILPILRNLHKLHYSNNLQYQKISETIFKSKEINKIEDIPYLPVRMFKEHELLSISRDNVFKILKSSGTTSSKQSQIYLDKPSSVLQSKVLNKLIQSVIGKERLPMLIVDSKNTITDRSIYSARGAGITGMSIFGKDHHYVLDNNFNPDIENTINFLKKYNGLPVLIFGFTFLIWEYLYPILLKFQIDLSKAILIHSGGWKKLEAKSVDNLVFKEKFHLISGLKNIRNFYGMVEQIGTVFIENTLGFLQCPIFTDIIIRNPYNLKPVKNGEVGIIQVISTLPTSYPGHSILTEDLGMIVDDNSSDLNNWKGKYVVLKGRIQTAELRGCSDTFEKNE